MIRLLIAVLFSLNAFAKSSAIPDKRDFPLDDKINPCTDFYKYVCDKALDEFQLPEDRSIHTFSFSDAFEHLLKQKKKYFSELANLETKDPRESMVKTYYTACMNAKARAKEEKAMVADVKKQLKALTKREDFLKMLADNRLNGHETPIVFYVVENQDKPLFTDVVLDVSRSWTSMPERSYYENPALVKELTTLMSRFFAAIGEKNPKAKANVVIEFEKGLVKMKPTPREYRDLYAMRTGAKKEDLLRVYPDLMFEDLFKQIPDHTEIRNMIPPAMNWLNSQLDFMTLDDLKTVYEYESLVRRLDDGYPAFFKLRFAFENKNFGGPNVRPDRQERCTKDAMGRFTPEVDHVLWQKFFPDFPRQTIVDVAEKIRGSIAHSLEENKWLSKGARKEAIRKIKTATLQLVAPQNDEEWNFRPIVQYDLEKPLHNEFAFAEAYQKKDLEELKGPISPKRWDMGPLTINAYYDESHNKFVLPVGILQYPFFDSKQPNEVNLGAIGTVIGHELGHSVDDKGSLYNADGVLKEWMSPEDVKGFENRTKILVKQFSDDGQNGPLTLGENIGDLVGLTASHAAAFDGKKYNQDLEKQFFIGYGRLYCTVVRPKFAEMLIKTNPHAQGVARVNEQIRQQPAFKKAFECKDSDAMVLPVDKLVHIW